MLVRYEVEYDGSNWLQAASQDKCQAYEYSVMIRSDVCYWLPGSRRFDDLKSST